MMLLGLLVAMTIGMAVYYGVTSHPTVGSIAAHTPGHGVGLAVLVIIVVVFVVVQFWPMFKRRNEEEEVEE